MKHGLDQLPGVIGAGHDQRDPDPDTDGAEAVDQERADDQAEDGPADRALAGDLELDLRGAGGPGAGALAARAACRIVRRRAAVAGSFEAGRRGVVSHARLLLYASPL